MKAGQSHHALMTSRSVYLPVLAGVCATIVLIVSALISTMGVRVSAREAIDLEVHENLTRLAAMAAATIDAEKHRTLTDPEQEGKALYERLNGPLRSAIRRTDGVRFVYTLRAAGDDLVFVLDGTPRGDADGDGVEDHSFLMDVYEDPDPAAWEAIETNTCVTSSEPYTDLWGTFLSGYSPIRLDDGTVEGVVGVDVSVDQYQARLESVDRAAAWALVPGLLLSVVTGFGVWWVSRRLLGYTKEIVTHREEAVRANEAKSTLLANISHELRTPLNAIIGFGAIADDEHCTPRERHDALGTVRSNAEHLLTLINDLLDISKAEAGAIRIETGEVDLAELIDRAAAPLRLRAIEKEIGFEVVGLQALPERVVLDRTRVRQVLLNLLSNAVKFTDSGCVTLELSASDGVFEMRVEDTGPGLSAEECDRLFIPFTQLGSHEKRIQGTGLGLAISRHLLELMGGSIELESRPGRGSVFTARVPYEAVRGSDGEARVAAAGAGGAALGGVRIAVAEDGVDNMRLLRLILGRAGAQIEEFVDGELARCSIVDAPDRFDLLITDWDMPVLSGEELVRCLRAAGWARPIISLTAHATGEQERLCLSSGCDAHMTKPLNAARLISTCVALLEQTGHGSRAA